MTRVRPADNLVRLARVVLAMRGALLVPVVVLLAACGDDSRVGSLPLDVGKPGVAVVKARRAAP